MTSDKKGTGDKPRATGMRFGASDEPALSLGTAPSQVREDIDRLFNVLASGEYDARIETKTMRPLAAVHSLLEASGRFRVHEDDEDELLHQARGEEKTETDQAVAGRMLQTLMKASREAKQAGDASPEAERVKEILGRSAMAREEEARPLDDILRSFLLESVSLLGAKPPQDED
jgi:hypothetical protein